MTKELKLKIESCIGCSRHLGNGACDNDSELSPAELYLLQNFPIITTETNTVVHIPTRNRIAEQIAEEEHKQAIVHARAVLKTLRMANSDIDDHTEVVAQAQAIATTRKRKIAALRAGIKRAKESLEFDSLLKTLGFVQ
jgi:hypothetical protein